MPQPDLFADPAPATAPPLDLAGLLDRLAAICERPRYTYTLLTLLAEAGGGTGRVGPWVRVAGERVPVRDWLSDAMAPVARRDPRRLRLAAAIRRDLLAAGTLPADAAAADLAVAAAVRDRLRRSGRTGVSRAASELVRAGLIQRYYQGDHVDHRNRGGQRHAVYLLTADARGALAQGRAPVRSG